MGSAGRPARAANKSAVVNHLLGILYLIKATLPWLLLGTPAQEPRTVTKASAGEVIVLDFNYQFGF